MLYYESTTSSDEARGNTLDLIFFRVTPALTEVIEVDSALVVRVHLREIHRVEAP